MICLSETHLPVNEELELDGYRFYGRARDSHTGRPSSGGVGILIRNDVFQSYSVAVCCADTEGILGIRLTHKATEYTSVIVSNYLPPSNSVYGRDSESFFNRLLMLAYECNEDSNLLYCGDFNAWIGHVQDAPFNTEGIIERDCIDRTVNSHGQSFLNFLSDSCCCVINGRENEPRFTCTTVNGSSVVDYVATTYDALRNITNFEVLAINDIIHELSIEHLVGKGSMPPDHNVLQLKFKSTGHCVEEFMKGLGTKRSTNMKKAISRKFNVDYMKNERIQKAITDVADQLQFGCDSQDAVDKIYNHLCDIITMEMEQHKKRNKRKHTPQKSYWSPYLSELWTKMQEKYKVARIKMKGIPKRQLLRMNQTCRSVTEYKESVNKFDRELKRAKRQHAGEVIARIDLLTSSRNPKLFWDEVNRLGPKRKKGFICEAVDADGNVTRDPNIVSSYWYAEYKRLYGDAPEGDFDDVFYLEKLLELEENHENQSSEPQELNRDISLSEIKDSIMAGKPRKSCGVDGIPYEAIQNTLCASVFLRLFNLCFQNGLIPSEWCKSEIVPIPKGKKSISTQPLTYRGLGLQSCIYKSYSYILNKRLTTFLEENQLIDETQNGFRRNRGCVDHVYTLTEAIRQNTPGNSKVYACFVDMRRAFDELDRNLLLNRLKGIGICGNMYKAFSSIYQKPICCIRLTDGKTDWMDSNYGTIQGDIISPQLFSVQINNLIQLLNDGKSGIYYGDGNTDCFATLACADDLVLVASTKSELQELVSRVEKYCKQWRMTVNVEKTKVMVFRKNYQVRREEISIGYGKYELEQVRQYKYLGVMLDEALRFNVAQEELANAGSRALGAVINQARHHKDLGYKTYSKIIDACVTPVLGYCGEVHGHQTIKKIADVQFRAVRYYLGLPRNTALASLNAEMGWLPIEYKRQKDVLRYYNRIMKMEDSRIPKTLYKCTKTNRDSWAQKTLDLMKKINLDHYWEMDIAIPEEILNFNIKEQYKKEWHQQVWEKPKLRLYRDVKKTTEVSGYVKAGIPKHLRSMIAQLRCGVLKLRLETGRYNHELLATRTCDVCGTREIENETHFIFDCSAYNVVRNRLIDKVGNISLYELFGRPFLFGQYLCDIWRLRNQALFS